MSKQYNEDRAYGYFVDRTAKLIKADINRKFRKLKVDLTPEQWLLLDRISQNNGHSQVELGEGTYKDAPTISRIVDLLCKKGLTLRRIHKGDRRKFMIYITDEGREVLKRATPAVLESRHKGWEGLSDEDYDHLIRIMNKVFDNLG